jgi:sugar O-acyltransferase (sialic acid O-acetyltransferase NeuD family)
MKNILIYGAGGNGRETLAILESIFKEELALEKFKIYFVETVPNSTTIHSIQVISEKKVSQFSIQETVFSISIAKPEIRYVISQRLLLIGIQPVSIVSPLACISSTAQLGRGSIIAQYSLVSCDTSIGEFTQINYFASISHDVIVGNYVTIGPGVRVNGHVIIEDLVFIGAQASIMPGTKGKPRIIGKGAVIGMGAVVTSDVLPYTTVVGNPAKEFTPKPSTKLQNTEC